MNIQKQIIALGGGGFSMEPRNNRLDRYILNQSPKKKPKICFVPTASGDSKDYTQRFYRCFDKLDCVPSHLSLFKPDFKDLESFVLSQDIIYVGGGNTFNLLALWKLWGLNKILKKAYEKGFVLCGISAGSICWFTEGSTDSFGNSLQPLKCLGFIKGSNCPHYDGESERRPTYHKFIKNGSIQSGYAADDGAGLHFINGKLEHVVSSRPKAKGYSVGLDKGKVREEVLETCYLKKDGTR